MPKPELFVPDGLLEVCKGWQEIVDLEATREAKDAAGLHASELLWHEKGFRGTRKVIVKGDMAWMLDDAKPEEDPGVNFRGLTVAGWLGRITYVRIEDFGSLTWPIYTARVFTHDQEVRAPQSTEQLEKALQADYQTTSGTVRKPLHFPVNFVDYALCAA